MLVGIGCWLSHNRDNESSVKQKIPPFQGQTVYAHQSALPKPHRHSS